MRRPAHYVAVGLICSIPLAAHAQPAPAPAQPPPPPSSAPPPPPPSSAQPMPPSGQPQGQPMQHQQPPPMGAPEQQQQVQYKGKVSDVWDTKLQKGKDEDKVVLIETDAGQTVLVDLGPEDQLKVEVEEGMPAMVTGTMMYMEGEGARRFVAHQVQLGKQALMSPPRAVPSTQVKEPQKQKVSGKIVDKEKMSAKSTKVDQQLLVVEVDPQTRVLVDLGPAATLMNLKLKEGDPVEVEGEQTRINERAVLAAETVQVGGKQVSIQRSAAPALKSLRPATPPQLPSQPRQPVTP